MHFGALGGRIEVEYGSKNNTSGVFETLNGYIEQVITGKSFLCPFHPFPSSVYVPLSLRNPLPREISL